MKSNEVQDIFICYRRDNGGEQQALLLYNQLTYEGYRVFLDVESLNSGKFNDAIFGKIRACTDVLVVLPPNALDRCVNEDDWVRMEIECAFENKKNVIPVMMRGFEWPKELPPSIADLPNYNGVTANSTELFDGIMLRLQTKLLQSKPQKKKKHFPGIQSKQKSDKDSSTKGRLLGTIFFFTVPIVGALLVLFADVLLILRTYYMETLADSPGFLFQLLHDLSIYEFGLMWLFLSVLGICLFRFGYKKDTYLQHHVNVQKDDVYSKYIERYSKDNIDYADFSLPFAQFQNKLYNTRNESAILEPSNSFGVCTKYSSTDKRCGVSVIRNDALDSIESFHITFSAMSLHQMFCVLFISHGMSTKTAIILLTKQGFECVEKRKNLYLFKKENCMVHLLCCFNTVQEIEVCPNGFSGTISKNTKNNFRTIWRAIIKGNYQIDTTFFVFFVLLQLILGLFILIFLI